MDIRIYLGDERPVSDVPAPVLILLSLALALQILWYSLRPEPQAQARALPAPPSVETIRVLGLDDPLAASRATMLWLQAFDNQPGISIPFIRLDYDRVIAWLDTCLRLDGKSQYPLLAASRLYTLPPDEVRVRKMLAFVYRKFFDDPDRRWVWLAHGVYVAKHRLHDSELALRFARALRLHTSGPAVPDWIREMEVYVLEDMGEIEAAKILIGGLLESGTITDPNEIRFLNDRLELLESDSN